MGQGDFYYVGPRKIQDHEQGNLGDARHDLLVLGLSL